MNLESEIRSLQEGRKIPPSSSSGASDGNDRVQLGGKGHFDRDLYGEEEDRSSSKYLQALPMDGEEEDDDATVRGSHPSSRALINASASLVEDSIMQTREDGNSANFYRENFGSGLVNTRIADRENEVL
jgi:hypothetical protein